MKLWATPESSPPARTERAFVRQPHVRSERARQRVMESITQYVEQRLKLCAKAEQSAVAPAVVRPLLGFRFFCDRAGKVRVTVAPKALKRAQDRVRQLTTRNWGVSMERRVKEINRLDGVLSFADGGLPFEMPTSGCAAGRGRCAGRSGSATNALPEPRVLGIPDRDARSWAASQKGYWLVAGYLATSDRPCPTPTGTDNRPEGGSPIPTAVSGNAERTAWCGPACQVGGRRRGEPGAYPVLSVCAACRACLVRQGRRPRSAARRAERSGCRAVASETPLRVWAAAG